MEPSNLTLHIVKNDLLKNAITYNFEKKLDEHILLDHEYNAYFANESSTEDISQFCCFMHLQYKSRENDIYTFDGSITYEECYHSNVFKFELVWTKKINSYYLNDTCNLTTNNNVIYDRENDGLPIYGSDIIIHFFKNHPIFDTTLPK